MDIGSTLLSQPILPLQFWDEAFVTIVYLINRLPTLALNHVSCFEKLFGLKSNYTSQKILHINVYLV